MKKTKPTVTVLVIAYNEEGNIEKFLNSVLSQKTNLYKLDKVLVVSDGSRDKTVSRVKSMKKKKIVLEDHKKRIGKSSNLTKMYQKLESDYLIQSDADVIFGHNKVINHIIETMENDKKIMMCGGNPLPFPSKTFIEKSVNVTVDVYLKFRNQVKAGNNPFSADGRLLAFRKKFIQGVKIPDNMIANDMFVYLVCKNQGYKYKFIEKATVYFRSPQTITDHIKQSSRFLAAPQRMKRYFPKKLLDQEYAIPKKIYYFNIMKAFLTNPLEFLTILLINCISRLKAYLEENTMSAKWDIAISTKKLL